MTEKQFIAPDGPEVRAAVAWWTKRLTNPAKDNGDGMQSMMAMMVSPTSPDGAALDRFAVALTAALQARFAATNCDWLILDCDYGPDEVLGAAGDDAGISSMSFPWKTLMAMSPGSVTVQDGYGRPRQTIFPATEGEAQ